MSEITQRVKYQVEFDASGLDKLSALVTEARQQFEAMGKTAQEVAANFNTLRNSKIKVTHTIRDTAAAVKVETSAVEEQKVELKGATRAIKELERELAKETQSLKANVRALDENKVANSRLAQEAEKSRRNAMLMATAIRGSTRVLGEFNAGAEKAIKATDELGKATENAAGAKFTFLRAYAAFQIVKNTIVQGLEEIREGAQNLDIVNTLRNQISNFDQIVEDVNRATANTIKESALNKSIALMSSFGLPADQFAKMMELVGKAAIRTGQSTEFLADSLARGVSRMSPLILDNLGIQLKLADAYDDWAAKLGKASNELTKNEQQAAVLNATLAALEVTTKGIVLGDTAGASVARFEKTVSDAWLKFQEFGGRAIQYIDDLTRSGADDARVLAQSLANIGRAAKDSPFLLDLFGPATGGVNALSRAGQNVDMLASSLKGFAAALGADGGSIRSGVEEGLLFRMVLGQSRGVEFSLTKLKEAQAAIDGLDESAKSILTTQRNFMTLGLAEGVFGSLLGVAGAKAEEATKAAMDELRSMGFENLDLATKAAVQKQLDEQTTANIRDTQLQINKLLSEGLTFQEIINRVIYETKRRQTDITDERVREAQKIIENIRLSEEANRVSRATVDAIQDAVDHRQRELEFASKTHILSIDANKAAERESALVKQIADVRKDYFDEEKAAERGSNKARLEALNIARQIAATQSDAARQAWALEDERLDKIIRSGKAAVQAEIIRLTAIIDQNKALMTQLEIYAKLPGVGGVASLVAKQMRQDTEVAIDSLARLKAAAAGIGSRGGRGRSAASSEVEAIFIPDAEALKWKARKLLEQWKEQVKKSAAALKPGELGLFGMSLETMTGMDANAVKEQNDAMQAWLKTVRTEFFSPQELIETADVGADALHLWTHEFELLNDQFTSFQKHIELLKDSQQVFDQLGTAFSDIGNAITPLSDLFEGTFGEEAGQGFVSMVTQMSGAFTQMGEALKQNADAYGLTTAAVGISRTVTSNLIKDLRARAGVEAAFQTALSAAAFATGNIPGGIAHAAAAALFAGVALGGKPKAADKDKTKGMGGAGNMNVARSDVHVHIQGTVVQTEAERGMMIQRAIREARAGGR